MLDECYCLVSPLNANQRPQARHAAREACLFGRGNDRGYVLVGAWGFLGDAAHRRTPNDDAPFCKIIDDLASAPLLERGVPRQRPSGAVARRGERLAFSRRLATRIYEPVPMLPPMSTG
jgi:hypothetical protein